MSALLSRASWSNGVYRFRSIFRSRPWWLVFLQGTCVVGGLWLARAQMSAEFGLSEAFDGTPKLATVLAAQTVRAVSWYPYDPHLRAALRQLEALFRQQQ